MLELLWLPFLACLVLAGIHAYLGLDVLARGVIFVDLALAQVAALGMTTALLVGYAPQSDAAYYYALAFTVAGAGVFALTAGTSPPPGKASPRKPSSASCTPSLRPSPCWSSIGWPRAASRSSSSSSEAS